MYTSLSFAAECVAREKIERDIASAYVELLDARRVERQAYLNWQASSGSTAHQAAEEAWLFAGVRALAAADHLRACLGWWDEPSPSRRP